MLQVSFSASEGSPEKKTLAGGFKLRGNLRGGRERMMNPSKTETNGGATLTSSAIRSKDFGTGITFSCC